MAKAQTIRRIVTLKWAAYKRRSSPGDSIHMADSYSTARFHMIEAQVRANDVSDPRIQAALQMVPREKFVAPGQRALAYADVPPPIAPGRFLLDPRSFAKALQLL